MYNFRKALASLSVVAILSTLVVSTAASAGQFYDDVPDNQWFATYVNELAEGGILDTTKKMFNPGANLNRAEAVKLLVEAFDLEGETEVSFKDVKSSDWYFAYVKTAVANGVVSGYADGTFKGGNNINRAEWAKVVVLASDLPECDDMNAFSDVKSTDWYAGYANTAYCWGVMAGKNGKFAGADLATRAEAAKMISVAMNPEPVADDDVADDDDDVVVGTGDVDVTVVDDSPVSGTIPSNATAVEVLTFELAASEAAEVDAITIKKTGVSSLPSGFQGYLYEGTDRLTAGKTLNSESLEMNFTNLNWSLAAGEKMEVTLKVDIGDMGTTSGEAGFSVTKVDAGEGEVSGLPVSSVIYGLSTTDVGTINVDKDGTITNPKVGEQDVTIAKFKLDAATEDAMLQQIGIYITGNVSTDAVQNLELYVSGQTTPLATVSGVNSKDVAVFVMAEAFKINKGDTKSFYVKADLNTGRNADTLKLYVDENTDVVAIGAKYGFGMTVTRTNYDGGSCTTNAGDCTYSALEGGDITISSSGPAASDISVNGKDVALMNFSITSVSPVTFRNFEVFLTPSESADTDEGLLNDTDSDSANFTDVKVVNTETGKVLMGPVDVSSFVTATGGSTVILEATDNAQAFYKYTDEFSMKAGETLKLALTTDIKNDTDLANMTIVGGVSITSSLPEVRDINNKVITNTSSIVPSSNITAKTMTLKSSDLTVSLASTPVSDTYVKGSKDVKFACFSMKAGQASSVKITSLVLGSSYDTNNDGTYATTGSESSVNLNSVIGSVKLVDGAGKEIAPAKAVTSAGIVTFENMSYTIAAGDTPLVCVQGDLSANPSSVTSANPDRVAFGITAAGSITAEDKNGNSLAAAQKIGLAVNGTPSTAVTVSNGGSLTVAVDPATAKEDIKVAGTTGVSLSKFKFTTTDEPFTVKKLSVNNRQSAATTAALGDYDNNVTKVKLEYKNSAGATETKDGFLTNGTANFSGMDFYIAKDEDAVVTVYADLNSIQGGGTAAEFVDLNLAFNDFEAIAAGSGETYKADKLDADVTAATDLDFGTITWTDSSTLDVNTAADIATATVGSTVTLTVNNEAGQATPANLPVGTLLCQGSTTTCATGTAVARFVVTAWTEGSTFTNAGNTGDSVTTVLIDNADTAVADADNLVYSLPGSGYLTAANRIHVYESKPALALTASSPSGSRNVDASDQPFIFSVTETGGKEKVQFRMPEINAVGGTVASNAVPTDFTSNTALDGTFTRLDTADTISSPTTDGINNSSYIRMTSGGTDLAGLIYTFGTDANLSGFSGISSWTRMSSIGSNTITLTVSDNGPDGEPAGGDDVTTTVAFSSPTAATWTFADLSFVGVASTSLDDVETLTWAVTDASAENAATYDVDEVTLYYDKVVINGTSDSDFDTSTSGGADNLAVSLRDGSTSEFAGYWYSSTQSANTSTIAAHLYPDGNDFEVAKGTAKTLAMQTSTTSLLDEDAGVDDPVTFSISLGSSLDSTITAGGFFWYDTNALVRWLGDVANTTFNSNTVKY